MIVDGVEYVRKEEVTKDAKVIMSPDNVVAFWQQDLELNKDNMLRPFPNMGVFRLSCEEEKGLLQELNGPNILTPHGTKISAEVFAYVKRVVQALNQTGKKEALLFHVFEHCKEDKFKKEYPVLFLYGRMCALIAPRVE